MRVPRLSESFLNSIPSFIIFFVDSSTLHIALGVGVEGERSYDGSLGPTGVNNSTPLSCNEVDRDIIITQTLEGYVLPFLPTIPLHIHNIHLKCETLTSSKAYYSELHLPIYKQNTGKYQVLVIDNIQVSYVFYPNGTIDIYTKNSDNPLKLQTDKDRIDLIAFIGKIKNNLPNQARRTSINFVNTSL